MDALTQILIGLLLLVTVAGIAVARYRRRIITPPEIAPQKPTAAIAARPTPLSRFFSGLARSREALAAGLARAFRGETPDPEWAATIEEALISADLGARTAAEIAGAVKNRLGADATPDSVRKTLSDELRTRLGAATPLATRAEGPLAILVVGVNGSGKTTTIGKLAARYRAEGRKVLLAAGDTFRAGAIEQLKVWGERAGVPVIAHQEGADPAAVIFDALQAGVARGVDVVICDTAGRLQAQKQLMDELGRVVRVMNKALPGSPHEVLLVLDATIGQNALSQARIFKEVVGVTGIVLTKLDGTARGGVVVAVSQEMSLPVKLVGLGEKAEDLRDFDPDAFVDALVGRGESGAPI